MADVYEKDLGQKSSLTTSDFIRVVGTDNASYKQLVSDVAKKIIENYTGSSLAGSKQSVKAALDSLNSNNEAKIYSLGAISLPATLAVPANSRSAVFAIGPYSSRGHGVISIAANTSGTTYPVVIGGSIAASGGTNALTITDPSGSSTIVHVLVITYYGSGKITA